MALADPQSVTISGTAIPLPRTGLTLSEGSFRSADKSVGLTVGHTTTQRRDRHVVKVQQTKVVSDPLVPSQNIPVTYSAHVVFDAPIQGVTAAELAELGKALVAWATAANIAKVVSGES